MIKAAGSFTDLIGNTPLLRLSGIEEKEGLSAQIYAKLECFNPVGSSKDRVALEMIKEAERQGVLKKGSTIIEPTSGNTGIGLAAVGRAMGFRVIIVMPENMSEERKMLMRAYGAELVLSPAKEGMAGAIALAEEIKSKTENSIIAGQFTNKANPAAHRKTTGPEIWKDTEGAVDILVCGVGTGGTITGTGSFLKEKNADIKVIAVEPLSSPMLSKGTAGPHKIQGIGANFIPEVLDRDIIDEIVSVSDEDALGTAREIAETDGVLVGISSGAAAYAAIVLSKREENRGKNIVAVFPDSGERYMSSGLFE